MNAGRMVAGWILEERLGSGGFGEVWRARRRHAGLPRALKLVRIAGPEAFESWRHEINRLETLSHPNVVRFYDADVVSDGPYQGYAWIATELCARSLADELQQRPGHRLGQGECQQLLREMLAALAAANAGGWVHRDLKPANILRHESGTWKLCDFGTARLVPAGASHADTQVIGTSPYMSPSAHRGQQDHAADLYALGVTLHEALCGERLHPRSEGMTNSEYIKQILEAPPTISPGLSKRWTTVIGALIGRHGPHTAGELATWFDQTSGATPPGQPAPPSSPTRGAPAGGKAAVALAAAGGAVPAATGTAAARSPHAGGGAAAGAGVAQVVDRDPGNRPIGEAVPARADDVADPPTGATIARAPAPGGGAAVVPAPGSSAAGDQRGAAAAEARAREADKGATVAGRGGNGAVDAPTGATDAYPATQATVVKPPPGRVNGSVPVQPAPKPPPPAKPNPAPKPTPPTNRVAAPPNPRPATPVQPSPPRPSPARPATAPYPSQGGRPAAPAPSPYGPHGYGPSPYGGPPPGGPRRWPPRAVMGRRLVAFVVDGLVTIFLISTLLSAFPSQYERIPADGFGDARDICQELLDGGASQCIPFESSVLAAEEIPWRTWLTPVVVSLLVSVVLQGLTGITPGKLLVGLRTVRNDGRRPGVLRAFVRWLMSPVDALPLCLPLVGFVALSGSRGYRRVGDKVAGTAVMRRADMRRR